MTQTELSKTKVAPTGRTPARASGGAFQVMLLVLFGLGALLLLLQAVRFLPVQSDNVYPESAGVLTAQRWAQGHPLYMDYRQPPYLMTAFPPLWYGLVALAAKAGVRSIDDLVLFGRLLSLACLLGLGVVGYAYNRRAGLSAPLSLLAPLSLISVPALMPWAVTARPDFFAILLAALALFVVGSSTGTWPVAAAAVLSTAAILAKHNTVAAAGAVIVWLVLSRRWKHAALFASISAALGAAVLLPFQISTDGLLSLNLSGAKFGSFALTYVRDVLARTLTREGNGFTLALIAIGLFEFIHVAKLDDRGRLIRLYLIAGAFFALLGTAAAGGGANHYFEPFYALSLLVPAGVARLRQDWRPGTPSAAFATAVTVALLLPALDSQRSKASSNVPDDLRNLRPLAESKRVFTDDPYLAARVEPAQAVDLSSLVNTVKVGGWAAWSSAGIAEQLRAHEYDAVILRTPLQAPYYPFNPKLRYPRTHRLDLALQTAILENYKLCRQTVSTPEYGRMSLYAPARGSCEAIENANIR